MDLTLSSSLFNLLVGERAVLPDLVVGELAVLATDPAVDEARRT